MNILFLTMSNIDKIEDHGIYTDLIRELNRQGNTVTVLSPVERKYGVKTNIRKTCGINLIQVRTGNLFNVNIVEKFVSRAMVSEKFLHALKKYSINERFDLIIYTTPPTTFGKLVIRLKKKYGAYSYLMLKDIFPQNAVDLGMIKKNSIIHFIFRINEKVLYRSADAIGCMSPANMKYLKEHDSWIDEEKIVECPNSIEVNAVSCNWKKNEIRKKYNLPLDKLILVYGGGLGKPQGINFFIECIKKMQYDLDIFFLVIGDGVYYEILKELERKLPDRLRVVKWLPEQEYEMLVFASDVGLVFLDNRFMIPNFPSRVLVYMKNKLPIIAATDKSSDVGYIAENNGFGYWCESRYTLEFEKNVEKIKDNIVRENMGNKGYDYLVKHYSAQVVATKIIEKVKEDQKK